MKIEMKFILVFVFTMYTSISNAQEGKLKLKWGKVSEEDRTMTVYEKDSTAEAVVLADAGEMLFMNRAGTLMYSLYRHVRIKILSEAGFDQAEKSLSYYAVDRAENIRRLKIQVINPDGTITKLDKDNIFEEEINDYWKTKKFTCPNIQVGSIIEYQYTLESNRFISPRDWIFQRDIPVRYSQLEFITDPDLDYIVSKRNSMYIKQNGKIYYGSDIPALKEESFISTMSDYTCKLIFQLRAYKTKFGMQAYLSTWKKIAEVLRESENFGGKIYGGTFGRKIWSEIKDEVMALDNSFDKANAIYKYVIDEVKWNSTYRLVSAKLGRDILTEKLGSSGDINIMILHLMQKAGLEAHGVITNPKSEGIIYTAYPFLDQFNHTFGVVYMEDGKPVYFDGSNECRPLGEYDEESLTGQALVIKKRDPVWVEIKPNRANETYMINMEIGEDNVLSGTVKSKFKGIRAVRERSRILDDQKGEFWTNRTKEAFPEIEISSFEAANKDEIDDDLIFNFDVKIPDAVSEVNDLLYIPTNLYSRFDENPFKLEQRLYPIDFGYPCTETIIYSVKIPTGFMVESMPENVVISTPEKDVSYRYICSKVNDMVQITKRLTIKNDYINSSQYGAIKAIFDEVENKSEEVIVLKKI